MTSFRIPSDVLATWKDALSPHRGAKGVDGVLKDVLAALQTEGDDGHVAVSRHQLFTWSQTLVGVAAREPSASASASRVSSDMRSYLRDDAPSTPAPFVVPDAMPRVAPRPDAPRAAPAAPYAPAAPVEYRKSAAPPPPSGDGRARLVTHHDAPAHTLRMLREARSELLIVSPWLVGFDGIAQQLLSMPPAGAVRVITRRPQPETPEYHRALTELRKKGVDLAFTNNLHTRMVLVDGRELLLGAAGTTAHPASREMAVVTDEAGVVQAARAEFERLFREAKGPA